MGSKYEIFSELADNLTLVAEKIKSDRENRSEKQVALHEFWLGFEESVNGVSSECTKLCLAFSSDPLPSNSGCHMFRDRVENATLVLVSALYKLPKSQGIGLYNHVFDHSYNIVYSIKELVLVVGEHAKSGHKTALQCTGGVWEYCESVTSMPKDAKQFCLHSIHESLGLVKDALYELEEAMKNEPEDPPDDDLGDYSFDISENWSEEDKKMCGPCIGLIKATKSALKKTHDAVKKNANTETEHNIVDLDGCVKKSQDTSPKVDDLIEALYPPMSYDCVKDKAEQLVNTVRGFLAENRQSHFIVEEDAAWVEFLLKAVDHNWTKLQTF